MNSFLEILLHFSVNSDVCEFLKDGFEVKMVEVLFQINDIDTPQITIVIVVIEIEHRSEVHAFTTWVILHKK